MHSTLQVKLFESWYNMPWLYFLVYAINRAAEF